MPATHAEPTSHSGEADGAAPGEIGAFDGRTTADSVAPARPAVAADSSLTGADSTASEAFQQMRVTRDNKTPFHSPRQLSEEAAQSEHAIVAEGNLC